MKMELNIVGSECAVKKDDNTEPQSVVGVTYHGYLLKKDYQKLMEGIDGWTLLVEVKNVSKIK